MSPADRWRAGHDRIRAAADRPHRAQGHRAGPGLRHARRQPDRCRPAGGRGHRRRGLGCRCALRRHRAVLRGRPGRARGRRRDCATARATNGCCRPRSAACCSRTRPGFTPMAATIRCRSTRSTTIRTTASCGRSRTAFSASASPGSTSSTSTTSACTSTAPRPIPPLMKTLARERLPRARKPARQRARSGRSASASTSARCLLEAMEWGQWDAFLLAGRYTLLEQAPLDDLLPKCVAAGTSIVVGGPLNSGILAGRDTWNYAPAPPEVMARVKAIAAICDSHHVPLAGGRAAIPARPPGGRRDHPRPAQRRRVPRQSRPAARTRSRPRCGPTCGRPSCCTPTRPYRRANDDRTDGRLRPRRADRHREARPARRHLRQFARRCRDPRGARRPRVGRGRQGIRRLPARLRADAGRPCPSRGHRRGAGADRAGHDLFRQQPLGHRTRRGDRRRGAVRRAGALRLDRVRGRPLRDARRPRLSPSATRSSNSRAAITA